MTRSKTKSISKKKVSSNTVERSWMSQQKQSTSMSLMKARNGFRTITNYFGTLSLMRICMQWSSTCKERKDASLQWMRLSQENWLKLSTIWSATPWFNWTIQMGRSGMVLTLWTCMMDQFTWKSLMRQKGSEVRSSALLVGLELI